MKKKNIRTNAKKHFNDLLLPIILILCVLPFVVYMAEYDYGYGKYLWHSDNSILQDFYTYYRGIFFLVIVFFLIVILAFRLPLYKEETKDFKIFLPLIGYVFFVLLSAVCSVNPKASWLGNFPDMEGAFALMGYCLTGFYAYQIMKREDYQTILRAIQIMFLPMSVIGWFQVCKHDLLNYEWVQKLVMSDYLFAEYGGTVEDVFTGNNVFLTLYNPNFAAVFLVMFACVFFVCMIYADCWKERLLNGILLLDALILCWFTYTRAALVALAVVLVVFTLYTLRKHESHLTKFTFLSAVIFFALLFFMDYANGGKYLGRLIDDKKSTSLSSILTTERGVEITYEGATYILAFTEDFDSVCVTDSSGITLPVAQTASGEIELPFAEEAYATVMEWDGYTTMLVFLENTTLQFIKEDGTYYYATDWGKTDCMTEIPHVDFHGLESLGSGRVYIWSRILPMLGNYIFIGSGPDTFAEVYPQNDYVGKMIYAKNPGRIIERAHNDYLMRWVQTGLLSLVCLLVFYVLFFKKCFSFYKNDMSADVASRLGFGCFLGCIGYLVCCFFSDSTLYTTPVFYVFIGLALAATYDTDNTTSRERRRKDR
ncbi:MAG: O-antigen ligase family protein [Roseburia sp.]